MFKNSLQGFGPFSFGYMKLRLKKPETHDPRFISFKNNQRE